MNVEIETADFEFHDGKLLPMDSIAVCPVSIEDLAELVTNVPIDLAGELARMAAWRALGYSLVPDGAT